MISVIVVAWNQEKYIHRCIRSILNQSLPRNEFETIVVNNGSTDKTSDILKSSQTFYSGLPFLKVIDLPENMGIGYGSNEGIKKALGQFVVRVDADDYINEKLLEIEYLFLRYNKNYDAVSCDYYTIDESEEILNRYDALQKPIACGIMYRKDRLIDIGLYNPECRLGEDKELRERFLKKYNIHNIELPLYRYRRHSGNSTILE
jgi:glycosyltransferase involved in cell wall biosynthesis